jgi:hypothetical protein
MDGGLPSETFVELTDTMVAASSEAATISLLLTGSAASKTRQRLPGGCPAAGSRPAALAGLRGPACAHRLRLTPDERWAVGRRQMCCRPRSPGTMGSQPRIKGFGLGSP